MLTPVQTLFQRTAAPVQFGLRSVAINVKEGSKLVYNVNRIRKENLNLLKQNEELKVIISQLQNADSENKVLREQLNLKNDDIFDKDLLLASVLGNSNDLTNTSVQIDRGSRHGVKVGNNVIKGAFLIGTVTEVSANRSIVKLITSPELSLTVRNQKGAEGLATGDLGTAIIVSRLLPTDIVAPGDIFISSGKDGLYLPGFSIGTVDQVSFDSADPLKSAILNPMLDFNKLERVFILLE